MLNFTVQTKNSSTSFITNYCYFSKKETFGSFVLRTCLFVVAPHSVHVLEPVLSSLIDFYIPYVDLKFSVKYIRKNEHKLLLEKQMLSHYPLSIKCQEFSIVNFSNLKKIKNHLFRVYEYRNPQHRVVESNQYMLISGMVD